MTTKQKKIRRLFEITQSQATFDFLINKTINSLSGYGDLSDEYLDKIADKINKAEIIEAIMPIYDKHYTESEIGEMIAFHSSPIGQKILANQLVIAQESAEVADKLVASWTESILKELDELEEKTK